MRFERVYQICVLRAEFSVNRGGQNSCNSLFSTWCSGNAFDPINEVTVRRARLILRRVTACGQVNHLGM